MKYEVQASEHFEMQLDEQLAYFKSQRVSSRVTDVWFGRLHRELSDLSTWPRRNPVDLWVSKRVGQEVRKLVFGQHLVYYAIDDEHRRVDLVAFRHGAQSRGV
jgi:hypothetical protein